MDRIERLSPSPRSGKAAELERGLGVRGNWVTSQSRDSLRI